MIRMTTREVRILRAVLRVRIPTTASFSLGSWIVCLTRGREGGSGTPATVAVDLGSCKQAAGNGETPVIDRSEL